MGWRELEKPWSDTTVEYCDVCGNLVIRRCFEFQGVDGQLIRACREDDERLYHTLLRYRQRYAASATGSATGVSIAAGGDPPGVSAAARGDAR